MRNILKICSFILLISICREQLRPVLKHIKMKSRITIEVDFNNGNLPVIQVLQQDSDDVRDNLIKSFLQSLQHTSRWCTIVYKGNRSKFAPPMDFDEPIHCWQVIPVKPQEIQSEMDLMWSTLHAQETVPFKLPTHSFGDKVGEAQHKDMIYQRSTQNPYPSDSPTNTAYAKGFTECWETFSKAEPNPNISKGRIKK